jgi:hypothetical protein
MSLWQAVRRAYSLLIVECILLAIVDRLVLVYGISPPYRSGLLGFWLVVFCLRAAFNSPILVIALWVCSRKGAPSTLVQTLLNVAAYSIALSIFVFLADGGSQVLEVSRAFPFLQFTHVLAIACAISPALTDTALSLAFGSRRAIRQSPHLDRR